MNDQYNNILRKVLKLVLITLSVFLGLFLLYKLSFYAAPFIIAFGISSLMEPIIRLLMKKLKLSRKAAAPISLLAILSSFGVILVLVIIKLIAEIRSISHILPKSISELYENISTLVSKGTDIYNWLPSEITDNIGSVISNISNSLVNLLNTILKGVFEGAFATAISIPEALVFTIATILSTYFISSDRDKIYSFFKSQLPESWVNKFISIKNDMFSALFGYIRAQLILMSITFTELFIGFSFIHIKYALLLAFVISIVDALPILGTGGILIPWSIYELLNGNLRMAVSLVIIYVIVLIVRQLIEPKILGQQIGIHPLLTLIAMYAGLKLIGFAGLILGPVTVLVLKNIFSGMMKNKTLKDVFDKT